MDAAVMESHRPDRELQLLAAIVEESPDGIVVTDYPGLRVLYANPAFAQDLGRERSELVRASIVDVAAGALDASTIQSLVEVARAGRPWLGEADRRLADGTLGRVQIRVSPRRAPDGAVDGFLIVIRDVTELRDSDEALRASEARYRSIVEAAAEGIYRTSATGKVLAANRAMATILGYETAAALVKEVADTGRQVWADPEARSRLARLLDEQGTVRGYECGFLRRDGTTVWVSQNVAVVRGPDGRAAYYDGFVQDITERNREARERERLAAVVEQSADGIVITDGEGRIVFANAAFSSAVGSAAAALVGQPVTDVATTVLDPTTLAALTRAVATGQRWSGEVDRRGSDGTPLRIEAAISPIRDADGDTSGWIGVLRDITERQRAHVALEASERRLRTALDTMLDGVTVQTAVRDDRGRITDFRVDYSNSAIGEIGGTAGSLQAGRTLLEMFPAHRTNGLFDAYVNVVETGVPFASDAFRYSDPDAAGGPLDQSLDLRAAKIGDGYVLSVRDVTERLAERKRTEAHIARLNQVLRTLSLANEALVRASDEATLLLAFCRLIVEQGAYQGAWVGNREDGPASLIRPAAWAGPLDGYLDSIILSWQDPDRGGQGPAGTSIREGRTVVVRDVAATETLSWRAEMVARGLRSVAALPLKTDDVAFGTLVIYAGDPDSFGAEEMGLLEELASDLAYGVRTLRARAEASRAEAERRRLATAVEQSADAVVITDMSGAIEYVNPAFERVSGYDRDEVLGQNPRLLKSGVQGPAFYAALWATLTSGQSFVGDLTNRRKDGGLFLEEAVISPILDDAGVITSYVAVKRDVTRERALEATQHRISRERAKIAGALANLQILPTAAATAEAICRQVVSLAEATAANLSYFTLEGPAMALAFVRADGVPVSLRRLPFERSRVLRERAEQGPWVEAWVHRVSHPYDRLHQELGTRALGYAPVRYGGRLIGLLTVTSKMPNATATLTEILPALLEFAGFAGARIGPAVVDLTEASTVRTHITEIIKTAAFQPVFQPVIDLATGAHAGYEALTRFSDGTSPDLVFAAARATGMETELEMATLAASIKAAAGLPPGAWLSLNVSPGLVTANGGFARLLRRADRPVVLEVTEHVSVADYAALRAAIGGLRPEVRLAVDDAGAGVANFGHIVELRPAFVKLDMSLVRGINADLTRQALMRGLLQFASSSASQTIAEGVETESELATLRALGVPLAQGYLLGRPSPVDAWRGRLTTPADGVVGPNPARGLRPPRNASRDR